MREDLLTTPTFIIGLGGVGQAITSIIVSRFLNSQWESLPETVKVRSIDTAPEDRRMNDSRIYQKRAFTRLGNFNADETVQNLNLFPEIQKWWKDYNIHPGFISTGAGAKRPVGRLVFFREFTKIHDSLLEDFMAPLSLQLQNRLSSQGLGNVRLNPKVFLVGSLAGGTCSGMFIDTAFLVRKLLESRGYERGGIEITGIFGLPSVIEIASKDGDSATGAQRRINAMGALRELDYLLGAAAQNIEIQYPNPVGRFTPNPPIFNQTYLFTSRNMQFFGFNSQNEVFTRVAQFIFGQVALNSGEETQNILDNHKHYFNPDERMVGDGLKAVYASMGVEWLEVPKQYLVAHWCSKLADRIGDLVVDFEWLKQPKVDLGQAFRERLAAQLTSYRNALGIIESGPLGIERMEGFSGLEIYLEEIQASKKSEQLTAALRAFNTGLPALLSGGKKAFSRLTNPAEEVKWLNDTVFSLIQDQRFRIGGARRFLEEAARQFRMLNEQGPAPNASIEDIVGRCKHGLFKRLDPEPALEWARNMVFNAIRNSIRETVGARVGSMALRCDELVNILGRLQDSIGKSTENLKHTVESEMISTSETALLDPADIDAALQESFEEVAHEIADRVTANLVQELSNQPEASQGFEFSRLETSFEDWVKDSIGYAAGRRARRPQDAILRLQTRMTQCQPLAEIDDHGPLFLELMNDSLKATPLKLVMTGVGDDKRAELDAWANKEKEQSNSPKAFQIFSTDDPLRDDVVNITMGWPLWLFKEVRGCAQSGEQALNNDPQLFRSAFVMNDVSDTSQHDIRPMPQDEAKKLFGIALCLEDIKRAGSALEFSIIAFGSKDEVLERMGDQISAGEKLQEMYGKAFERFRSRGYSWKYSKFIEYTRRQSGDGAFRSKLEKGLNERRQALNDNKRNIPEALYRDLTDYYARAERFTEGLIRL